MSKNIALAVIVILVAALALETGYLMRVHQEPRAKEAFAGQSYPIGPAYTTPQSSKRAHLPVMAWHKTAPSSVVGDEAWDPFEEMADLQRIMDRMFRDSFTRGVRAGGLAGSSMAYQPDIEMKETKGEYIVHVDLPGIDKDKMDVKIRNGMLTISGERTVEKEQTDDQSGFYRTERSFGSFLRSVPLPADADADRMTAETANGVLTVRIPKLPSGQSSEKKVAVK